MATEKSPTEPTDADWDEIHAARRPDLWWDDASYAAYQGGDPGGAGYDDTIGCNQDEPMADYGDDSTGLAPGVIRALSTTPAVLPSDDEELPF